MRSSFKQLEAIGLTLSVWALLMTSALCQQTAPPAPAPADSVLTLKINSRLTFLDVTVLDRKNRPVTTGLTKDDFTITEEKKPQRIFSFEAPDAHIAPAGQTDTDGKAPATILVIDELNDSFDDMAFIRYEAHRFLAHQPEQLASPTEILLLGNNSLEMVQGFTRSRADLLATLDHIPAALPWKLMVSGFSIERLINSIDALQQIALQNKGVPGRKNIVWVGHGGPGLNTFSLLGKPLDSFTQYVHETTNMLVDSRISLFLIYPGLKSGTANISRSEMTSFTPLGDQDPFDGDINFGVFVNETGGKLFYNHNDVDQQMRDAVELGANYYTLTYQPPTGVANGAFRRIRVTLRNPELHLITKAGYFAPDKTGPIDPKQQTMTAISDATRSTIPLDALVVTVTKIVRHADTQTADFDLDLSSNNLAWHSAENGKSESTIGVEAVSMSKHRDILA